MNSSKKTAIIYISFLLFFCLSTSVYCEEPAKQFFSGEYGRPAVDYGKIVFATLFIVVAIVISLALLKKTRFTNITNQGLIQIIHSQPITSKDKLLIVNVGQEYLLLGLSSAGLSKIKTLDKGSVESSLSVKNIKANEFANIFVSLLGKKRNV